MRAAQSVQWPALVDDTLAEPDHMLRLDMIERLGMLGSDWSRQVLERARSEESDPHIVSAIDEALAH